MREGRQRYEKMGEQKGE
jgi:hypothetical protein